MKTYRLSVAAAMTHTPAHPERTARKEKRAFGGDVTFQVWPSRGAMLTTISMKERRAPRADDWRPLARRAEAAT